MAAGEILRFVVVEVDERRCALLASDVHEVLAAVRHTLLPGAPAGVEGVVNIRGSVVPVLDLRARFGLTSRPVRPADRLVVVESAGRRLALRVDGVVDLVPIPAADVVTEGQPMADARHTAGVAKLADGLLVICDLDAFLSADEGVALDLALVAHGEGSA